MSEGRRAFLPVMVMLLLGTELVAGGTWYAFFAPRFAIDVTVLDPSGVPVSGLPVECYHFEKNVGARPCHPDPPGSNRFTHLPPGEYALCIATTSAGAPPSDIIHVHVGAGASPETIVRLVPCCRIDGSLRDEQGGPIAGTSVTVAHWPDRIPAEILVGAPTAKTDAAGAFTIHIRPPALGGRVPFFRAHLKENFDHDLPIDPTATAMRADVTISPGCCEIDSDGPEPETNGRIRFYDVPPGATQIDWSLRRADGHLVTRGTLRGSGDEFEKASKADLIHDPLEPGIYTARASAGGRAGERVFEIRHPRAMWTVHIDLTAPQTPTGSAR